MNNSKSNGSINYSSVATVENSKTLKVNQPYVPFEERLISEPKFMNENIFEKHKKLLNEDFSRNPNKKSGNLYITSLDNKNNDFEELQKFLSNSNNFPKKSTSIKKRNLKLQDFRKNSQKLLLPYLPLTSIKNASNPSSPMFTSVEQNSTSSFLDKLCYEQNKNLTEGFITNIKIPKNVKKESQGVIVETGKKKYISQIKDFNMIKYYVKLKKLKFEEYNYKLKQQIRNIDLTSDTIKKCMMTLKNKNLLSFNNDELRNLESMNIKDKLEEDKEKNKLSQLKIDINNLKIKIGKNKNILYNTNIWLRLQIFLKEEKLIDIDKIKDYINKNYKGKLVFETIEEFDNIFKKKEKNNLILLAKYNQQDSEKVELNTILNNECDIYNKAENQRNYNENDKKYLEKTKLLGLLKKRNMKLIKDKNYYKEKYEKGKEDKISLPNYSLKNEETKKINLDKIYAKVQDIFNLIIENGDMSNLSMENQFIYIDNSHPNDKALNQLKLIELNYNYLSYYTKKNKKGNEVLYQKVIDEIERKHKIEKIRQNKMEEQNKGIEFLKKLKMKHERVILKMRHQDKYSALIYINKIKKEAKRRNQQKKKELDIFDFLSGDEDE